MNRDFRDYVADIIKSIDSLESFTKGMSYEEFIRDEKTVWAVIRGIEIIGEAVKNLPDHLKEKHPDIPWREMTAMRNKLIHEYFGVDVRVLWLTVQKDIPSVKPQLSEIFKSI